MLQISHRTVTVTQISFDEQSMQVIRLYLQVEIAIVDVELMARIGVQHDVMNFLRKGRW